MVCIYEGLCLFGFSENGPEMPISSAEWAEGEQKMRIAAVVVTNNRLSVLQQCVHYLLE